MRRTKALIRSGIALLLAVLVAAGASLAIAAPALAAEPTLEVLQVGWDGLVVPGKWSPVRIRIVGGSADLSGRVEVVTKARYQPGGPQATAVDFPTGAYGQELALPAGVTKEVTLWVPGDYGYGAPGVPSGSVRLVTGGRTVVEERIEFRSAKTPYWPVMGVLADSPAVARAITQVELPVQGLPVPLSAASLAASDLPASADRLGALEAMVVQGSAATTLTGEQRSAVLEWVTAGGHLVLMGGPDGPRVASILPAGSIPVSFSGAEGSADLSPLGRWAGAGAAAPSTGPAARFKAEGGSVLVGTPDRPLAWRMGIGQGTVTLLAVDPGLEPLAGWPGTRVLLQKALEPALPSTGDFNDKMLMIQMQSQDVAMQLRGAVEALPPEAFPNWQTIALILGVFLLLVGPLFHLVLWRTDRRVWAWAIVPAAALLLAGGMYYLGVGREGRDVLVNVISHLRLDPKGGPARQSLVAGFFAPTHSEIAVDVPGDVSVKPQATSGYYGPYGNPYGMPNLSASTEPPFRVVSGRDTRVEFASGQWGMRSVSISRSLEGTGGITAHLELDGELLKGSVRNDTPYPLEDAAVLMGQGVARLGSLAPGQTAQVVLDPGPPASPFGGGRYPISWRVLGKPRAQAGSGGSSSVGASLVAVPAYAVARSAAISSRMPYPPGMEEDLVVPQDPEVQRRLRLMDPVVNVPKMGPGSQAMALTFFAFTRVPVGEGLPYAAGHPSYHLSLLEQPLSLELPPGPFSMPGSVSTADIIDQTGGMGGGSDGTINWIQIQSGSMTYSFKPPVPARATVEALTFTTQQMGQSVPFSPGKGMGPPQPGATPGPAEAGVFHVYNWQAARWEPLPGGKDKTRLEPAAPYLGPGGEARLMVVAPPDRVVMFIQPELAVEGRVEQ